MELDAGEVICRNRTPDSGGNTGLVAWHSRLKPTALVESRGRGDRRKGCVGSPCTCVQDPLVGRRPHLSPFFCTFTLLIRLSETDAWKMLGDVPVNVEWRSIYPIYQSTICCLGRHRRQDCGLNKNLGRWCYGGGQGRGGQVVSGLKAGSSY